MALFGSFGKALGLGSAGEVAGDVASFLGFSPKTTQAISSGAQAASEAISSIGEDRPDVATSPQQAGVDSPATILNVSQTGQLSPLLVFRNQTAGTLIVKYYVFISQQA